MGKTKIKTIDDSTPSESPSAKATGDKGSTKGKPKDALAASLLEQLNQEFGEVEARDSKLATREKKNDKQETSKKEEKRPSTAPTTPRLRRPSKAREGKEAKPKHGKKYLEAAGQVEKSKKYSLNEAVELAQKTSYTKFEGSVEAHINTVSKNIRGLISLPFALGRKLTVLAFGKDANTSGADLIGSDETIEEISKGKINFDVLVTTPEWMAKLAKVAKILGPRGLMPNPKSGTITDDLKKTVSELQAGKMEYKTETNGQVIHLGIGKVNQPTDEISANIKTLYQIIGKSRIKKITLSSTMGPGVKVDLSSI